MIELIIAIIAFVLVIGVLVLIHEAGHFYFAKKAGILCHEFSIGMGPLLYSVKKGETIYSIRAIPIGGYVSMAGEDMNEMLVREGMSISINLNSNRISEIILNNKITGDVSGVVVSNDLYGKNGSELYIELNVDGENIKYNTSEECYYVLSEKQKMLIAPYDRCFESKKIWPRFITILAGPLMNFILAFFIFIVVGLGYGVADYESNLIGSVSSGYSADGYLEEGDEVIEINGYEISTWTDISSAMSANLESSIGEINIVVIRDGEELVFDLEPIIQINSLGITNIGAEENTYGSGVILGLLPSGNRAAKYGLEEGDVILSISVWNSETNSYGETIEINTWFDIIDLVSPLSDSKLSIDYARLEDGEYKVNSISDVELFTDVTLSELGISKISYAVGISCSTSFDFVTGLKNGLILLYNNATMIFTTLAMILGLTESTQITVGDLSGPLGIFSMVQDYLATDVFTFLSFVGMLSVNFFVVNLLPLPALDGGRLVFLGYEAVTKKPVKKEVENMINNVGFILLMVLFVYVTYKDLLRL